MLASHSMYMFVPVWKVTGHNIRLIRRAVARAVATTVQIAEYRQHPQ